MKLPIFDPDYKCPKCTCSEMRVVYVAKDERNYNGHPLVNKKPSCYAEKEYLTVTCQRCGFKKAFAPSDSALAVSTSATEKDGIDGVPESYEAQEEA